MIGFRKTLIPYTQKLHRRTAKIVDNSRDAKTVMRRGGLELHTGDGMDFEWECVLELKKDSIQIQDLGELFESRIWKALWSSS
jgi:hypothetical protein